MDKEEYLHALERNSLLVIKSDDIVFLCAPENADNPKLVKNRHFT